MVEKFLAGFEDCLLHVPLTIRGPGIEGGRTCGDMYELTDLYPTLMELLELETKHDHFGQSLAPLAPGVVEAQPARDAVFPGGTFENSPAIYRWGRRVCRRRLRH